MSTSKSLQSVYMCVTVTISKHGTFHLIKSSAPHPSHSYRTHEGSGLQIAKTHCSHWLLGIAPWFLRHPSASSGDTLPVFHTGGLWNQCDSSSVMRVTSLNPCSTAVPTQKVCPATPCQVMLLAGEASPCLTPVRVTNSEIHSSSWPATKPHSWWWRAILFSSSNLDFLVCVIETMLSS